MGIVLSKQLTTKTLIRFRGSAGWSASLLFAYGIRQFLSWRGSDVYMSEVINSWSMYSVSNDCPVFFWILWTELQWIKTVANMIGKNLSLAVLYQFWDTQFLWSFLAWWSPCGLVSWVWGLWSVQQSMSMSLLYDTLSSLTIMCRGDQESIKRDWI